MAKRNAFCLLSKTLKMSLITFIITVPYTFQSRDHMEKCFWGVMRQVENLPDRHTEKKSRFVVFGPKRSL